jgi:Uma2 family endonuclease
MDVILTPYDIVQPDILFISKDRLNIIDGQVKGAPDLVIEILSEGNMAKEMSYKKHIFESTGVQEYWLINPAKKRVTQYKNEEGEFFPIHILDTEGVLNSIVVEGFSFKIGDIFQ